MSCSTSSEQGGDGIPGVYTDMDTGAPKTVMAKRGELPLAFSEAWIKSPKLTTGQDPIMHYNRDLMMAVMWDPCRTCTRWQTQRLLAWKTRPQPTRTFSDGSPKKFVIDPHNTLKIAA
jgi:glutathione-independent formaldehyde dehydrogenase